ncbi:RapZ C-terminal domain-containing protein [Streptosporangium sp. G11]|uniref:RapZ C-terminal domain-containing protein n=1 Tax=Streptosporangium sp. G11 TaxID=3436926 RepID=UPI003EBCDA86
MNANENPPPSRSPREAALRALARWAGQQSEIRPRLIEAAWRAGEHNIRAIARAASVSRGTVYADLSAQGIDYTDRSTPAAHEETVTTYSTGSHLLQVVLTSYGVLHRDPPEEAGWAVNLTTALRNSPDDPEVRERMVRLTGLDAEVRAYVLETPGALEIVGRTADQLRTLVEGWGNPTHQIVRGFFYCRGGRHCSVAIAEEVAVWLRAAGYGVEVDHLDIAKPVVA